MSLENSRTVARNSATRWKRRPGGRQIQLLDPDDNPIELFEPAPPAAAGAIDFTRTQSSAPRILSRGMHVNRRQLLGSAGALLAQTALPWTTAQGKNARAENKDVLYGGSTLPAGIRSNRVDTNTGATLHVLEAGYDRRTAPCVVLLHGFPELAYSWRNQLLPPGSCWLSRRCSRSARLRSEQLRNPFSTGMICCPTPC